MVKSTYRNFGNIEIEILKTNSFEESNYLIFVKDSLKTIKICHSYKELIEVLESNTYIKQIIERVG